MAARTYVDAEGAVHTGYASDAFVDTAWSSTADLTAQGIPECGDQVAPSNEGPDYVVESMPQDHYDRDAAVAWAREHARDVPPEEASCTFFVSNALWAGGLDKTAEWSTEGNNGIPIPGNPNYREGTPAAWHARLLMDYIVETYPASRLTPVNFTRDNGAIPEAAVGDFIAYDWENDDEIDHLAFITDIATNQYPEVSEWSVDGMRAAGYDDRGWSWSSKDNKWLQEKYPEVTAQVVQINTTPSPGY